MTTPITNGQRRPRDSDPAGAAVDRAYRWAWLSLAFYPVAFVGAFVVGEGLASLYGYESGSDEAAPWWVALAAGGPALLILAVPAGFAVHFGRRAVRGGRTVARVPMWLGVGLTALFVAQNLVSYLVWVLG